MTQRRARVVPMAARTVTVALHADVVRDVALEPDTVVPAHQRTFANGVGRDNTICASDSAPPHDRALPWRRCTASTSSRETETIRTLQTQRGAVRDRQTPSNQRSRPCGRRRTTSGHAIARRQRCNAPSGHLVLKRSNGFVVTDHGTVVFGNTVPYPRELSTRHSRGCTVRGIAPYRTASSRATSHREGRNETSRRPLALFMRSPSGNTQQTCHHTSRNFHKHIGVRRAACRILNTPSVRTIGPVRSTTERILVRRQTMPDPVEVDATLHVTTRSRCERRRQACAAPRA